MSKTLYLDAFCGEFGWELMKWIPYCRWHVRNGNYDRVIANIKSGFEYLYKDFVNEFTFYKFDGEKSDIRGFKVDDINSLVIDNDIEFLNVSKDLYTTDKLLYYPYGRENPKQKYDILIHARNTNNMNTQYRNWPKCNWDKFVNEFKGKYSIASIGHKEHSIHINNTIDLRDIGLEELTNTLTLASCCIGPSSGPMHLASLCSTPHVVWTDKRFHKIVSGTNKLRYEDLWNPFKAKVSVVDSYGWQPQPVSIINATKNILNNETKLQVKQFGKPTIAMVTYNRPEYFDASLSSLERSGLEKCKPLIFDDASNCEIKIGMLRKLSRNYQIFNNPENYGVFTNSKYAIDISFQMCNDKYIIYSQDDIEYKYGWYKELDAIINKIYTSGIDWGIIALVYYHEPKEWSHDSFHVMPTGHPGGACWAISRNMWNEYRSKNKIFDFYGDRRKRERLFDFKISHWCHTNEGKKFAVCHVKNSLVRHIGADSTLCSKDMSQWSGRNYNG